VLKTVPLALADRQEETAAVNRHTSGLPDVLSRLRAGPVELVIFDAGAEQFPKSVTVDRSAPVEA
jgi:hypothetical protein